MKNLKVETNTYFQKKAGRLFSVALTILVMAVCQQAAAAEKAAGPLKIIKSFNPDSITTNDFVTLTIAFNNPNSEAVTFTTAYSERLPIGMIILGSASTSCGGTLTAEPNNSLITLTNAKVPAYSACQILVGVTAFKAGNFASKTSVASLQTEKGNRLALREATLKAVKPVSMDLRIKKTFNPTFIKLNEFTTLMIALKNPNGEVAKFEAPYSDYLPDGMVILGAASTNCEGKLTAKAGTSKVILTDVKIPPHGACEILLGVTAPEPQLDLGEKPQPVTATLTGE